MCGGGGMFTFQCAVWQDAHSRESAPDSVEMEGCESVCVCVWEGVVVGVCVCGGGGET